MQVFGGKKQLAKREDTAFSWVQTKGGGERAKYRYSINYGQKNVKLFHCHGR